MTRYTVTLRLGAALAGAVAVEWTNQPAPVDSGRGWEPCLRLAEGVWRFSSADPAAAAPHRRDPGPFADLAIRYRVTPAGSWSPASAPRKAIEIVADEQAELVPPAPPLLLAAPALMGDGRIGGALAVDPGRWTGAPAFAFQWRRDGADVPGASARAYALGAADDGCAIACMVTATSLAGFAAAAAAPVRARYAPPRATAALAEEVFDARTGPQRVETAGAFAGEALVFAVEGGPTGLAIDRATGVLSVPTALPVDGAEVVIVASNSGGRAEARLRYTVELVPEQPFGPGEAVVLRSLWLPEGQARTYGPELAFPGLPSGATAAIAWTADPLGAAAPVWRAVAERPDAPGVWRLEGGEAGLFVDGDPRATRLRFRWRTAQAQDWSAESAPVTAPRPGPALAALLAPAPAAVQAAMEHPLRGFKVDATFSGNNEGVAIQNAFAHCPVPLLALEAWSGQTRSFLSADAAFSGRRSGAARLLEHLRFWLTQNRAPAGRSGYNAQYEGQFVVSAAIARATPAVWGALSDAERHRLDLAMLGCAIGSLWVTSDANPYAADKKVAGPERTVRGYKAQRGGVPNYSGSPRLIPFVVDAYLRQGGGSLQAFLTGFDRDAFAAEVANAGQLADLHDTYRQDWTLAVMAATHPDGTLAYGPGPDKALLHRALRDGFPDGIWRGLGLTLDQGQDMYAVEFNRFFNRVVRPGPETYGDDRPLPGRETGPGWTTAHGLKTPSPLPGIDERQLRGVLGSANPDGTTNKSAWAGLPNPWALGMMNELDGTDGGPDDKSGIGGSNPALRSCTTYTYHGASALANLTAAAVILGVLDARDPRFSEPGGLFERMRVGVTDFLYRTEHGHREYSKGAQEHPNRDWNLAYIEAQGAQFETWKGMWRMIDVWSRA